MVAKELQEAIVLLGRYREILGSTPQLVRYAEHSTEALRALVEPVDAFLARHRLVDEMYREIQELRP